VSAVMRRTMPDRLARPCANLPAIATTSRIVPVALRRAFMLHTIGTIWRRLHLLLPVHLRQSAPVASTVHVAQVRLPWPTMLARLLFKPAAT
jgi:hypothetical protein